MIKNKEYIDQIVSHFITNKDKWREISTQINGSKYYDSIWEIFSKGESFQATYEKYWSDILTHYKLKDIAREENGSIFIIDYAILALMTWDDCAYLLKEKVEDVRLLSLIGNPAAILLYPVCLAMGN